MMQQVQKTSEELTVLGKLIGEDDKPSLADENVSPEEKKKLLAEVEEELMARCSSLFRRSYRYMRAFLSACKYELDRLDIACV